MTDDLTTAYLIGAEDMRDKLHKQADEVERLKSDIERLEMMLREEKHMNQRLRDSYGEYVEREKELHHCLKFFVSRDYYGSISFEEAIRRSRRVLEGK